MTVASRYDGRCQKLFIIGSQMKVSWNEINSLKFNPLVETWVCYNHGCRAVNYQETILDGVGITVWVERAVSSYMVGIC